MNFDAIRAPVAVEESEFIDDSMPKPVFMQGYYYENEYYEYNYDYYVPEPTKFEKAMEKI